MKQTWHNIRNIMKIPMLSHKLQMQKHMNMTSAHTHTVSNLIVLKTVPTCLHFHTNYSGLFARVSLFICVSADIDIYDLKVKLEHM